MAAKGKEYPLSIVVRSVDQATAGVRRINERINRAFEPYRRLSRQGGTLIQNLGLPGLARGFADVGREARALAFRIGAIAAAAGLSVRAIKGMIDNTAQLSHTAERLGMTVDGFAQLRFAAGQANVSTGQLESAMDGFNRRLGEVRAGTGQLYQSLKRGDPTLLRQLQAAQDNEEAFLLLADAIAATEDPSVRAARANEAFGRSGQPLVNMLAQGRDGIERLRAEYRELAGSQEEAAKQSRGVQDALGRVGAATQGARAAVLGALGPSLVDLANRLANLIARNREAIAEWARDFGEKLPGRIQKVVEAFKRVGSVLATIVDAVGGIRNAVLILVGLMGAKLVVALGALAIKLGVVAAKLFLVAKGATAATAAAALGPAGAKALGGRVAAMGLGVKALGVGAAGVGGFLAGRKIEKHFDLGRRIGGGLAGDTEKDSDLSRQGFRAAERRLFTAEDAIRGADTGSAMLQAVREFREGAAQQRLERVTQTAKVELDFKNVPRGARATVAPESDADVDLAVGYQMVTP